MFGVRAFYRGAVVFAMLPHKHAIEKPNVIAYKRPDRTQKKEGQKWLLCELNAPHDIDKALACLDQAYKKAVVRGLDS